MIMTFFLHVNDINNFQDIFWVTHGPMDIKGV